MRRHPDIIKAEDESSPFAPLIIRTNVATSNPNVIIQGPFYRVSGDKKRVPLYDYFRHGYESLREFSEAIDTLISRWRNREGECIEKRLFHGSNTNAIDDSLTILRLRFHDTPGCRPDEAWLPRYLTDPIPIPEYAKWQTLTPYEQTMKELLNFIIYGEDKELERHHRLQWEECHKINESVNGKQG